MFVGGTLVTQQRTTSVALDFWAWDFKAIQDAANQVTLDDARVIVEKVKNLTDN